MPKSTYIQPSYASQPNYHRATLPYMPVQPHGPAPRSAFYRVLRFQCDEELFHKLNEMSGATGLTLSELMRQAISRMLGEGRISVVEQELKSSSDDDPSNPL